MPQSSRFAGRVVAVTGAAQGIGRATAFTFAAEGAAAVALIDKNAEGLAVTAAGVGARGAKAVVRATDCTRASRGPSPSSWRPSESPSSPATRPASSPATCWR